MRLRTVRLIAVGILLVPLAAEAAMICFSQWCEVMGGETAVQTPMLDSIGLGLENARDSLAESARSHMPRRGPRPLFRAAGRVDLARRGDGHAAMVARASTGVGRPR